MQQISSYNTHIHTLQDCFYITCVYVCIVILYLQVALKDTPFNTYKIKRREITKIYYYQIDSTYNIYRHHIHIHALQNYFCKTCVYVCIVKLYLQLILKNTPFNTFKIKKEANTQKNKMESSVLRKNSITLKDLYYHKKKYYVQYLCNLCKQFIKENIYGYYYQLQTKRETKGTNRNLVQELVRKYLANLKNIASKLSKYHIQNLHIIIYIYVIKKRVQNSIKIQCVFPIQKTLPTQNDNLIMLQLSLPKNIISKNQRKDPPLKSILKYFQRCKMHINYLLFTTFYYFVKWV
eukprot:TRINITY_DN12378_c0_g1_i1.p3 TRINITY_DN12378_c0_g1~~TRINITY_DN12378_c0_g1_i1.p3  ORF type:complete len:292 (-),score=-27.46 TRINITY_DN12378_c0_g1_i1:114-989(-)